VSKIVLCAAVAGFIVDVAIAIENFADLKTSPNFAVFWKIFIGYFFCDYLWQLFFRKELFESVGKKQSQKVPLSTRDCRRESFCRTVKKTKYLHVHLQELEVLKPKEINFEQTPF